MSNVMDDEQPIDWSKRHEPEMRERIVSKYYDLAIGYAQRKLSQVPKCVDPSPVESAALEALLWSIDRYDESMGFLFTTYAGCRIKGAILDAIRTNGSLPRMTRKRSSRLSETRNKLAQQLGRSPTVDEVNAASGMTGEQLKTARIGGPISIDKDISKNNNRNIKIHETIAGIQRVNPFLQSDEFRHFTRCIDLEGQTILYLYYYRDATMKDIGKVLGLCESRVSQLHKALLQKIRLFGKERLLG